jgi:hypothetical protein
MKPFASIDQMIRVHEAMWGPAGRTCAELVVRHVRLFDEPVDPLQIHVCLAPDEIGPYNRHHGWTNTKNFILANRHICDLRNGELVLRDLQYAEDFLVHELTHHRQHTLSANPPVGGGSRGAHRDPGRYGAIAEAAPRYLGFAFPKTIWPN